MVAGRVLWVIPASEATSAAEVDSDTSASASHGRKEVEDWLANACQHRDETPQVDANHNHGVSGQTSSEKENAQAWKVHAVEMQQDHSHHNIQASQQPADSNDKQRAGVGRESNDEMVIGKDKVIRTPSVVQVDRRIFEHILLTMEMAADHLPDSYLEIIQQL